MSVTGDSLDGEVFCWGDSFTSKEVCVKSFHQPTAPSDTGARAYETSRVAKTTATISGRTFHRCTTRWCRPPPSRGKIGISEVRRGHEIGSSDVAAEGGVRVAVMRSFTMQLYAVVQAGVSDTYSRALKKRERSPE